MVWTQSICNKFALHLQKCGRQCHIKMHYKVWQLRLPGFPLTLHKKQSFSDSKLTRNIIRAFMYWNVLQADKHHLSCIENAYKKINTYTSQRDIQVSLPSVKILTRTGHGLWTLKGIQACKLEARHCAYSRCPGDSAVAALHQIASHDI